MRAGEEPFGSSAPGRGLWEVSRGRSWWQSWQGEKGGGPRVEREESGLELHPEGGLVLWRPLAPATCLAE